MIVKSINEILSDPWEYNKKLPINPTRTPSKWMTGKKLTLDDIKLWEEIYFRPGLIGVYAAWDPYEDFYIIVHLLHPKKKYIEIFYGQQEINSVIDRCRSFGIELSVNEIFINN